MSNLDQLVTKIIADGETKARELTADANKQAEMIIQGKVAEANMQKEALLTQARAEAARMKAQIISGTQLEIRDKKLKAKQDMIDQILEEALNQLKALPKEAYVDFVCNYLTRLSISGDEEILLADTYKDVTVTQINEKLATLGNPAQLRAYSGTKKIDNGFLLAKNGVENNNTYEALLNYFREDLEHVIVENLF